MVKLLSLRAVFAHASRLRQVADPSPVVTISLYRLLLAILQRSQGGSPSVAQWRALLARGAWDDATQEALDDYLTRWHARFDLFDLEHPFYQTAGLRESERTGAASVLVHQRASTRNKPLLFDHTTRDRAWLTPAAAACALLAQQNFAVGGLISYDAKREPLANKITKMAPLLGVTVCLVRGRSLFETLLLNWVGADHDSSSERSDERGDGQSGGLAADLPADLPAWERDQPTAPETRAPDGLVDLLTWQSRRIRLIPGAVPAAFVEEAAEAQTGAQTGAQSGVRTRVTARESTVVERAILMKGYQLDPTFDRSQVETMVPFYLPARFRTPTSASASSTMPPSDAVSNPPAESGAENGAAALADATGGGTGGGTGGASAAATGSARARRTVGRRTQGERQGQAEQAGAWAPQFALPGRAVWRDVAALLTSQPGARHRPRTLDWLRLALPDALSNAQSDQATSATVQLDVYSMTPDQAIIQDWRFDSLRLPLAFLTNERLIASLVEAVALAEAVGRLLGPGAILLSDRVSGRGVGRAPATRQQSDGQRVIVSSPVATLADALLSDDAAHPAERLERDHLIAHWDAVTPYWTSLTAPFHQLISRLATSRLAMSADRVSAEVSATSASEQARDQALLMWGRQVERAVRASFHRVVGGSALNAGAYRAGVIAQIRFDDCLAALLTPQEAIRYD